MVMARNTPDTRPKTLRDMDEQLWQLAKAAAIRAGVTLPEWISLAIIHELNRQNQEI